MLRLPLESCVPAVARTGIGSPVMRAVSTCDEPSYTSPSHGTISPGRTSSRSPTVIVATSTSFVPVPSADSRWAIRGASSSSARTAADARPSAYRSRAAPPLCISTMTSPAISCCNSTAATTASMATTSVAKWPLSNWPAVRQTRGSPVIASPSVQTVVALSEAPAMRSVKPVSNAAHTAAGITSCCRQLKPGSACRTPTLTSIADSDTD